MDKSKNIVVGLDIGGTNMRLGLVKENVLQKIDTIPIFDVNDKKGTLDQLIGLIEQNFSHNIAAIGMGVPSLVDLKTGVIFDTVNIPSWKVVPLKVILEERFNVPVYINNDANCFAIGEKYFGHGKDYDNMVGLISGTGTGAGIISNGKLVSGRNCGAGEFGMVSYLDQNYENYCSGGTFKQAYGIEAFEAFEKAKQGNTEAVEIWKTYGQHFAELIKMILYTVDPEMIVLGGSLSKAYTFYKNSMLERLGDFAFKNAVSNLKIEVTSIENIAVLGAASLYYDALH
ncbi:MAG: ROK family protein [Bacteroidales bacterium]|nr:ROK family protein [Bacteroidales bacterium]